MGGKSLIKHAKLCCLYGGVVQTTDICPMGTAWPVRPAPDAGAREALLPMTKQQAIPADQGSNPCVPTFYLQLALPASSIQWTDPSGAERFKMKSPEECLMKRHMLFFIMAAFLLSSCTKEQEAVSGNNPMQDSLNVAFVYMKSSYADYGEKDIFLAVIPRGSCFYCWNFTFDLRKEGIAESHVTLELLGDRIIGASYAQDKKEAYGFEECLKEGYEIKEYYPRECITPGGARFYENVTGPRVEQNPAFQNVSIIPTCMKGKNAGEIHYNAKIPSGTMVFQTRILGKEYEDKLTKAGTSGYISFSICEGCSEGEFSLLPDKAYIFRIRTDGKIRGFSNEYLIDTRNTSEFLTKDCKEEKINLRRW